MFQRSGLSRSNLVRIFLCRNNSLGVELVVACGVERYVSRNCDNRVLKDGSSLSPAFIARLNVCTNRSVFDSIRLHKLRKFFRGKLGSIVTDYLIW